MKDKKRIRPTKEQLSILSLIEEGGFIAISMCSEEYRAWTSKGSYIHDGWVSPSNAGKMESSGWIATSTTRKSRYVITSLGVYVLKPWWQRILMKVTQKVHDQ